jgi:hypothetical protein
MQPRHSRLKKNSFYVLEQWRNIYPNNRICLAMPFSVADLHLIVTLSLGHYLDVNIAQ